MRRLLDSGPSPAMVVALIALFVALGGSGYAAISIKNGSLPGKKLKRNSVTGKQVKESTLATVGRARNADTAGTAITATRAANAGQLDGLSRSDFGRRGWGPDTGKNKDIFPVAASPTLSSTFSEVAVNNCSGKTIEVRR